MICLAWSLNYHNAMMKGKFKTRMLIKSLKEPGVDRIILTGSYYFDRNNQQEALVAQLVARMLNRICSVKRIRS